MIQKAIILYSPQADMYFCNVKGELFTKDLHKALIMKYGEAEKFLQINEETLKKHNINIVMENIIYIRYPKINIELTKKD